MIAEGSKIVFITILNCNVDVLGKLLVLFSRYTTEESLMAVLVEKNCLGLEASSCMADWVEVILDEISLTELGKFFNTVICLPQDLVDHLERRTNVFLCLQLSYFVNW